MLCSPIPGKRGLLCAEPGPLQTHRSVLQAAAALSLSCPDGRAATRAARREPAVPAPFPTVTRPPKRGFYCILFCNGGGDGPIAGLQQVVSPPKPRQDGLSGGGRGGLQLCRLQLWLLTVNAGFIFFLLSVSPGRGLFPGRKLGKSTLLKCSGGLCSGKPSGFARQPPEIRVGGCKEVAFEHCEVAPVPPIASLPAHPSLGGPLG